VIRVLLVEEDALAAPPCDVVLAGLKVSDLSGVDLLERLRERDRALPVLVLARDGAVGDAVAAMRAGALDALAEPVEPEVIVERVREAVERGRIGKERDLAADDLDLKRRVRALERHLFREALRRAGGKKSDAARLLGIDASNWAYHAKRLKLQ
jgi:DNA-binding NtrC family response regulator